MSHIRFAGLSVCAGVGTNRLAGRCVNWRNEDQLLLGNQPVEMFKVARRCVGDNTEFNLVLSPINPLIAAKGS